MAAEERRPFAERAWMLLVSSELQDAAGLPDLEPLSYLLQCYIQACLSLHISLTTSYSTLPHPSILIRR